MTEPQIRLQISQERAAAAMENLKAALERSDQAMRDYLRGERPAPVMAISTALLQAIPSWVLPACNWDDARAEEARIIAARRQWLDEQNQRWHASRPASTAGIMLRAQQFEAHMRRWYTGPRAIMARKLRRAFITPAAPRSRSSSRSPRSAR